MWGDWANFIEDLQKGKWDSFLQCIRLQKWDLFLNQIGRGEYDPFLCAWPSLDDLDGFQDYEFYLIMRWIYSIPKPLIKYVKALKRAPNTMLSDKSLESHN